MCSIASYLKILYGVHYIGAWIATPHCQQAIPLCSRGHAASSTRYQEQPLHVFNFEWCNDVFELLGFLRVISRLWLGSFCLSHISQATFTRRAMRRIEQLRIRIRYQNNRPSSFYEHLVPE